MSYPFVPAEALQTPCISECRSTVLWGFDDGEPATHWHAGTPEIFVPMRGCDDAHLEILSDSRWLDLYAGELYRQLWQWEQVLEGARLSKQSSRKYLGAGRYRALPV